MRDGNERRVDRLVERDKLEKSKQIKRAFERRVCDKERQKKLERENAKAEHEYNIYRSA